MGQNNEEAKNNLNREEFNNFLAREQSFNDVDLVKIKDLSHIAPTIEF